jgi:hypothetical protein
MHIFDIALEQTPTTWDDSALIQATAIFKSLNNEDIYLSHIRNHFDLMVDRWFSDIAVLARPNAKDAIHQDWKHLGMLSINWGRQGHNLISLEELHETLVRKQRDYGHQNIARFGRQGLLIRVHDKVARLENLMKFASSGTPNFESIQDTVMDLAGYSTIGMMWELDQFLLPLK